MIMTDFEDKLTEILSKILLTDKENITDDLKRKNFEPWDSMAHLVIITEIENEFDIFFEDEEIVDIWSVADIKRILAEKLH